MELIADILLVAGAIGAGFYCFVLARRLNRFNDLEKGVGGAVAVLSAQVDDLTKMLDAARVASNNSGGALEDLTSRAEQVAQRLELIMASMHDVSETAPRPTERETEPATNQTPMEDEKTKPTATGSGLMFMRHDRGAA